MHAAGGDHDRSARGVGQAVEFPDSGHWIHDDNPDGCAQAILEFLSNHPE